MYASNHERFYTNWPTYIYILFWATDTYWYYTVFEWLKWAARSHCTESKRIKI